VLEFISNTESDTVSYLERLAAKRAAQYWYLADGTEFKGMSLKKKFKICLPTFFV